MPKRKVYVEAIVEGRFSQNEPHHHDDNAVVEGHLKHYKAIFPVDFEYKNKANIGGESWDWAQSHFPDFIPEDYDFPVIITKTNGEETTEETIMVRGKLFWACITCVYNKKGDPLPIAADHGRTKKTTKKKAKKKAPKAKPVPLGLGNELTIEIGGRHPSSKGVEATPEDKALDKVLGQAAAAVEDRTKEAVKKATKKSGR